MPAAISSSIEDKLSVLHNFKLKPDKQLNVSVPSLNKQFSFYAIALFFNKLIEFNVVSDEYFSNQLIMVRKFKFNNSSQITTSPDLEVFKSPIEYTAYSLIYCLKLWHKFNSHKEFLTVVTKCLSNSKLDLMAIYKNFISQYYNNYSLALNLANSQAHASNWETINSLSSKLKIPALSSLFMSEKCDQNSFEVIFK